MHSIEGFLGRLQVRTEPGISLVSDCCLSELRTNPVHIELSWKEQVAVHEGTLTDRLKSATIYTVNHGKMVYVESSFH